MSDAAGQPPHGFHFLSLPELFFEAFLLGDVAGAGIKKALTGNGGRIPE